MLLAGYVIVGLAVGADVPASWTLIAEMAPDGARGKHSGVAQVLWYCGPRNEGKTLEQIQLERHGASPVPRPAPMPRSS